MPPKHQVYLEIGKRRTFAGALEWPGWCRSARDEAGALEALVAYAPRYLSALGTTARLAIPTSTSSLEVVERLQGNATTDFGAPAVAPKADEVPVSARELSRQQGLLQACWAAFDAAARNHSSATLRKGPRGGGRELPAIVAHVLEADRGYLSRIGGELPSRGAPDPRRKTAALRDAILVALTTRARGEPPAKPRRSGALWTPRYFVRRSAWHALDHAWEIEDRADR
jgi:hypothetical protein